MADTYFMILSPGLIASLSAGAVDSLMKGSMGFHFILRLGEAALVGFGVHMLLGFLPGVVTENVLVYGGLMFVGTYFFFNNSITAPILGTVDSTLQSMLIRFQGSTE